MMQLKNGRRQLRKILDRSEKLIHRGESARRRALYGTEYRSLYLLGGTLVGFGLGYLAAYYLRRYLPEDVADSMGAELSDWGSTENPLHGDHDI